MSEWVFIKSLQAAQKPVGAVPIGIGDDAALWIPATNQVLVTTDMLLDGKHFIVGEAAADAIGHKSLAVNLSDIAAMGGAPHVATVSLALPRKSLPTGFLQAFYRGMQALGERHGVTIIGGDTNSWDGAFAVSITVLGLAHPSGAVTRSGGRAGDVICVTGPLGGSLSGRHLSFEPRVREARSLLQCVRPTAMMDVSDGLATDLRHLVEASGCAAHLRKGLIPIADAARGSGDPLKAALCDGEDFELLVTLAPGDFEKARTVIPLHKIGVLAAGEGLHWEGGGGEKTPIAWTGFQHQF